MRRSGARAAHGQRVAPGGRAQHAAQHPRRQLDRQRHDQAALHSQEGDRTAVFLGRPWKIAAGAGAFAGMWFKDADPEITKDLKLRGLLLHSDRTKHNYPFCWRCDRPLLYFATTSWFVRTRKKRDELVALNQTIHWHPEHVGEGRFGNWLENVVDWALSRRRYWGTPLPLWRCDESTCGKIWAAGSFDALFEAAGREKPADLYDRAQFDPHRPFIDEFAWPCACGTGTMRRVPEVIDAWFDSGAMPFAQQHYMGKALPHFDPEKGIGFPANFISEAVDQTRGWFYTLHAIGTFLTEFCPEEGLPAGAT